MILPFILFLIVLVAGSLWLLNFLSTYPDVMIYWAGNEVTISTTKLVALLLVGFLIGYVILRLLKHLISLSSYIKQYRKKRRTKKARHSLVQGLISLVDGNWKVAEQQLTSNVADSEIPVLNYLGAAHVAHKQKEYEHRDQYYKKATEQAGSAKTAIAIAQAESQLYANQLEQARAGLITLLEEHPKHSHAKKLLAKSYFIQEDWKNLACLLPTMSKQNILTEEKMEDYETAALKGVFQMYATKENQQALKAEWKKLPSVTQTKPTIVHLYSQALIASGDSPSANKLITSTLNKNWDNRLMELYGIADQDNLNKAIQQAEKWLPDHQNNPLFLLSAARLYSKNQLWGKARSFYESSLNLAPNEKGYLELAELLDQTGEKENAELCYRQGLDYCIRKKGKALTLMHSGRENSLEKASIPKEDIQSV